MTNDEARKLLDSPAQKTILDEICHKLHAYATAMAFEEVACSDSDAELGSYLVAKVLPLFPLLVHKPEDLKIIIQEKTGEVAAEAKEHLKEK